MSGLKRLTQTEAQALLNQKVDTTYKMVAHQWVTCKASGKQICGNCGLVYSNAPFPQWAIDKGCLNEYHPQYKSKRKLTNPFN